MGSDASTGESPAPAPKVVLVTGAGRRVGRAIAERFGSAGACVAVHVHRSTKDAQLVCDRIRGLGGQARHFEANLYDRSEAQRLVDEVARAFGRIDVVVASAANFDRIEFCSASEEDLDTAWRRALDLNLLAPFWLAHRAAPWLRASSGNVVVVTCSSATRPYRHYLPYTVSKAAVRHLVKSLALELAPAVRVNAVAPGTVLPPDDMSDEQLQRIVHQVPLKRTGSAQDIADAVYYLSEASYVSGHELVVDGGATV